jgi:ABC-type multidrug transport system ATPase subunit
MDEPTARRGIAVILSTHDPDHAFLCADRLAMLHEGRLAYGVDVEVHAVPRSDGSVVRVCLP